MRNQIFIAHHHRDARWLERLTVFLAPLVRQHQVQIWDETAIGPGDRWRDEIEKAIASAKVAVLLVSQDFLASDFIIKHELPLLIAAGREGLRITWVPLSHSMYAETAVGMYQAAFDPAKPLFSLSEVESNMALVEIAEHILSLLKDDERPAEKETAGRVDYPSDIILRPGRSPKRFTKTSGVKKAAKPAPVASEEDRTFVCYARKDERFVLTLASGLKDGGANLWLDQWDIPSGADWDYEIDKALYGCPYFLIVLSPAAVESEEVRGELRTALDERKRIVPVLYQSCRIPRRLRLIQHIDCTSADSGGDAGLRQILSALRQKS